MKANPTDPAVQHPLRFRSAIFRPGRLAAGVLVVAAVWGCGLAGAAPARESAGFLPAPAWGSIAQPTNSSGVIRLEVRAWPADSRLELPTPFPNISAAYLLNGRERLPLRWVFNPDATQLTLELPARPKSRLPATILLETVEKTAQFPDGRIVFSALDAQVDGGHARLESHPGNHRLGFWTDPGDAASWSFKPSRWGMYDVELTFSADGGAGTELEVAVGAEKRSALRASTGSWYRYSTLPLGRIYVARSELFVVRARGLSMKGAAVMNLKAVTLRPAPEGKPVAQEASGEVILAARDALTHGTLMRYEPATNKNCLGYWANPADWAEWEFTLATPGRYEVEVWQGCGKGQGGSEVSVEVDETKLPMTVLETGHFQTFVPRRVGRVELGSAGLHTLALRPLRKRAGAVMDVRQVRLVPVDANAPPPRVDPISPMP